MKGENPLLYFVVRKPKIYSEKPPMLLLMHGVGSNEEHMDSLAQRLPEEFLIISARAPFENSPNSFRWFEVNFVKGVPSINEMEAEKSIIIINQFINQLKELYTFDEKSVFIGGFSQGAIMSYSVGLTHPEKFRGIIGLSGRILKEIKPLVKTCEKLRQMEVLTIHGKKDQVLPIHFAKEAKEYLSHLKVHLSYHETGYDHSITEETIQIITDWLQQLK